MKIAFMILAHDNIYQLNLFIRQLLRYSGSYVYIHLDAKAGNVNRAIISDERVFVLPKRYSLNWGDYSLIKATNYLISCAQKYQHHDYYSFHSGVDMAIKPVSEFANFLENDGKFFYANFKSLPSDGWQYGGGMGRIALKWPRFFRKKVKAYSPIRFLRGLYGRLYNYKIIRKLFPLKNNNYEFYGGSEWFTASSECIEKTMNFLRENSDYDLIFRDAISSDEIYFNTVFEAVKNGRDAECGNNLRYIDWSNIGQKRSVGGPNICTMEHLEKIENSGKFFARKMDVNTDEEIILYFAEKC